MVTRSRGTAIIVRTERMTEAMTNSMRVKPRSGFVLCPRWKLDSFIGASFYVTPDLEAVLLLNGYGWLRPVYRNCLKARNARSPPRDWQGPLPSPFRRNTAEY